MSIKTDAMIAHNGADGYTIHVDYDPDTDDFELIAIFNDGTEKSISGSMGDSDSFVKLLDRTITEIDNEDVTVIGSYACSNCNSLTTVNLPNVLTLVSNAFNRCQALQYALLPSVTSIGANTFLNCTAMRYAYIGAGAGSPANAIGATAFSGCDNIVIDCGFSSTDPAAANAPWGATNATVNYDVAEPNPPVGLSMVPDPGLIQNIDLEPLEDIQPVEPEPVEVKKTRKAAK